MKKVIFTALFAIATASGIFHLCCESNKSQFSLLALNNIEALSYYELGEVTISCNSGYSGRCFREAFDRWVMKGEDMYHPCQYTGCESDFC